MRELLILRHAKSDWNHPGLRDHERPLAPRGQVDAPRVGEWMKAEGLQPDHVLCSTAVRTRETLDLLEDAIPPHTPVEFLDGLYHASVDTLLAHIREVPSYTQRLLVVGHNPGLHQLIWDLPALGSMSSEVRKRLRKKLPTASLAHFRLLDVLWEDVAEGSLEFVEWVTPKELRS